MSFCLPKVIGNDIKRGPRIGFSLKRGVDYYYRGNSTVGFTHPLVGAVSPSLGSVSELTCLDYAFFLLRAA
jgi:hypothetical protein